MAVLLLDLVKLFWFFVRGIVLVALVVGFI